MPVLRDLTHSRSLAAVALAFASLAVAFGSPMAVAQSAGPTAVPAAWRINEAAPPTPDSATFVALVTRLACNSGETGQPQPPIVTVESDRIVVTFSVTPLPTGEAQTCPSNNWVPFTVNLDQTIGQRQLVDGACLDGGAAINTAFCEDGGLRWSPATAEPGPAPPAQSARPVAVNPNFTG